jgi:chloramphenicol-sensitive protein RarD
MGRTPSRPHDATSAGIAFAACAYVLWGVFPLYFKAVRAVSATEILAHRVVWSLACVACLLAIQRRWGWIAGALGEVRVLGCFAATAVLVSANWGLYIWAVNADHVIDASLGYFINPLVSVLLGAVVLRERLRRVQTLAIALAALGVAWLTWRAGALPWIGLALALSFGLYGLLRKIAPLGAVEGLALETMLLFPIAFAYLAWLGADHRNAFIAGPAATRWLLVAAGPITAAPLLLFAASARRIPLSLLGVLQYIAPTLQWLLGVFLYREPFDRGQLAGFAAIWVALAIYAAESAWAGGGWRFSASGAKRSASPLPRAGEG